MRRNFPLNECCWLSPMTKWNSKTGSLHTGSGTQTLLLLFRSCYCHLNTVFPHIKEGYNSLHEGAVRLPKVQMCLLPSHGMVHERFNIWCFPMVCDMGGLQSMMLSYGIQERTFMIFKWQGPWDGRNVWFRCMVIWPQTIAYFPWILNYYSNFMHYSKIIIRKTRSNRLEDREHTSVWRPLERRNEDIASYWELSENHPGTMITGPTTSLGRWCNCRLVQQILGLLLDEGEKTEFDP